MKNYFFLPPPLPVAKEKTVMVRLLFFPRASARQLFAVSFSDFDVFARYDFGHCRGAEGQDRRNKAANGLQLRFLASV